MPEFNTLKPVKNLTFQVAWESTLKCNLDCSYCGDGHDNTQSHPPLAECLSTVDFITEYLDIQMSKKTAPLKKASLNIQGGESIFHPNIVEILQYIRSKKASYETWRLSVSLITNAISGKTRWSEIVDLVDYFTISYHSEANDKQQDLFKDNVLYLKEKNKNFHVAILMHPKKWERCQNMIEWCKANDIKYLPRQLDHHWLDFRFNYNNEQVEFLTGKPPVSTAKKVIAIVSKGFDLSEQGRACCGGNEMCLDGEKTSYVNGNNFKGWSCSVDKFFLYIRQTTGEIFTNKDCRMNFDGSIGPIGNLANTKPLLDRVKTETDTIVCKKSSCWCGLCAPKAALQDEYTELMKQYHV